MLPPAFSVANRLAAPARQEGLQVVDAGLVPCAHAGEHVAQRCNGQQVEQLAQFLPAVEIERRTGAVQVSQDHCDARAALTGIELREVDDDGRRERAEQLDVASLQEGEVLRGRLRRLAAAGQRAQPAGEAQRQREAGADLQEVAANQAAMRAGERSRSHRPSFRLEHRSSILAQRPAAGQRPTWSRSRTCRAPCRSA